MALQKWLKFSKFNFIFKYSVGGETLLKVNNELKEQ